MTIKQYNNLIKTCKGMEDIIRKFKDDLQEAQASIQLKNDLLDLSTDTHKLILDLEATGINKED